MGKERDLDAAERALGTLPRKGESPKARRSREAWEMRLAALLRPVPAVTPPPGLFTRISEHLSHVETRRTLARTRQSARRWKGIAILTGLTAAGLAAVIMRPSLLPESAGARYVAVVASQETGDPAMVVDVDTRSGIATLTPFGVEAPEGQTLEMWHLFADGTDPVSIGLFPAGPDIRRNVTVDEGDGFAISIEPSGGSPTGQPSTALYLGTVEIVQ